VNADSDAALAANNEMFHTHPLHHRMAMRIEHRESTHAITTMELTDDVRGQGPGTLHGGAMATLADATSALALWGTYESGVEIPVTTDMHIRYYGQPRSSPVRAESRVVHRGRRLLSVECSITDADDRQLARATATYMVIPRLNPPTSA
jgi:uncharacterized protein (TIGR00369 family)